MFPLFLFPGGLVYLFFRFLLQVFLSFFSASITGGDMSLSLGKCCVSSRSRVGWTIVLVVSKSQSIDYTSPTVHFLETSIHFSKRTKKYFQVKVPYLLTGIYIQLKTDQNFLTKIFPPKVLTKHRTPPKIKPVKKKKKSKRYLISFRRTCAEQRLIHQDPTDSAREKYGCQLKVALLADRNNNRTVSYTFLLCMRVTRSTTSAKRNPPHNSTSTTTAKIRQ